MIYIVGCAKAGTTLLHRLFYAFEGLDIVDNEIEIPAMMNMHVANPSNTYVCKRARLSPYSYGMSDYLFMQLVLQMKRSGVKLINIIRDGRDVITSDLGQVGGGRWIDCCRQAIEFPQFLQCQIRYEDLVTNPDKIQEFVAKALGLTSKYPWSTYPNFVPEKVFDHQEYAGREVYRPRPISNASVGKDLEAYKIKCRHCLTAFRDMLTALGYINKLENF